MELATDFRKWEDRSHMLKLHVNKTIKKAFVGKTASVQVSSFTHLQFGEVIHLWIRRHDEKPMGWTELQRTKNEILGAEIMAIQVFPKQSNVIDQANMYHLWAFPEFDFGVSENSFVF